MKRIPEKEDLYIECPARELATRLGAPETADIMRKSHILVVTDSRIELAADEKQKFLEKFEKCLLRVKSENENLTDAQVSTIAMREVLFARC